MGKRIRIIATSDIHGFIYPTSYADGSDQNQGMAKLSTLIQDLRDENTILIDNGDNLEGSPLSFFHYHRHPGEISPMTLAMNAMEYDYINIGNHDFNYGEKALMNHLKALDAPCITSNILYKHEPLGATYAIRECAGKKVAIFGVCTQYVPNWETAEHIRRFSFLDACETAKKTVELVRRMEKPDYIVCVYHGGFERDLYSGLPTEELTGENEGYQILQEVPGIDVLITGHQHRSICGTFRNTAYTQIAANGAELAVIDLYTDTHKAETQILAADTRSDLEIERLVSDEEAECQQWLDTPLGVSDIDLSVTDETHARLSKAQIITFMNMVAMNATGAEISASSLFLHATGLSRQITMRNIVSTYVYPNTLVVKQVTGKILKEYLERDAEFWTIRNERIAVSPRFDYPKPQHYNYDMLDGVSYTIKVTNDIGSRILDLTYQGQPVTDDMTFTLCVNNYRAVGGGNFPMLAGAPVVKEVQSSMVELMAEYIMEKKVIDFVPVDNIKVIL